MAEQDPNNQPQNQLEQFSKYEDPIKALENEIETLRSDINSLAASNSDPDKRDVVITSERQLTAETAQQELKPNFIGEGDVLGIDKEGNWYSEASILGKDLAEALEQLAFLTSKELQDLGYVLSEAQESLEQKEHPEINRYSKFIGEHLDRNIREYTEAKKQKLLEQLKNKMAEVKARLVAGN